MEAALPANDCAAPRMQRMRLEVDVRRGQLLELGCELFALFAYEDLSIGAIARAAGISKGLLYHYFSSKHAFYTECMRHAAGQLSRHSVPLHELSTLERVRAGLDSYLGYVERHPSVFAAQLWRAIADDRMFPEAAKTPIGRNALGGWVGFIEACVVDWIDHPEHSLRDLQEMFVRLFDGVVIASAVNVKVAEAQDRSLRPLPTSKRAIDPMLTPAASRNSTG